MAQPLLQLSSVLGGRLLDRAGERLGKVEDVIVRLSERGFPPVTGLRARIGGRDVFVPADRIDAVDPGRVSLKGETLNLGRFERRQGEVLLREDVLGRKLIDVEAARLVTANEIELACIEGWWRVVGIDPSSRARLRRLLPGAARRAERDQVVEWTRLEPFVGHVPTSRLRLRHRNLARLHPAQIADLVEAASHDEGEEIIEAVGHDRELEADVFEELDHDHQLEFLRERSDDEAAKLIARMEPDDAADLISRLDQPRRKPVLALLPGEQQRQIVSLLGYNPSTAGGLMNPEFVSVGADRLVADALRAVRDCEAAPQASHVVYLHDSSGMLSGAIDLVALLKSDEGARLADVADLELPSVPTSADLPEVARVMSDFNMISLGVVDEAGRLVGVVTVDDIVGEMLPDDWRLRHRAERA